MRDLEAASLVRQHVPGRYWMHDLVRLYAVDKARTAMSKNAKAAALRRVTDFYLHSALAGDRLLHPHRPSVELGLPAAGSHPLHHGDKAAALAWFDAEHSCLLAAQKVAVQHKWLPRVWQFAWALNAFHTYRGHCRERIETWQIGIAAAEKLGAVSVQSLAHGWLGQAYAQSGWHSEALGHFDRAICLAQDAGDTIALAYSHLQLSRAYGLRENHRQALDHARGALELFQPLDQPAWEAQALSSIGWHQAHLGHLDQGRESCEAALLLYRQVNNLEGEVANLDSLGYIAHLAGSHAAAREHYQQALSLCRDLGHTYHEADIQASLAEVHAACDEHDQARTAWEEALRLYKIQRRTAEAARIQQQLARQASASIR
jgi:tetratricopeptide (TPR) repeat protein